MALKLKKMVSMQARPGKRLDIQNDATIGGYGIPPSHTTLSGHKMLMGESKAKVAEMPDGSHMATNSPSDVAMIQTHKDAIGSRPMGSHVRAMPPHGGRKSTTGRRIY